MMPIPPETEPASKRCVGGCGRDIDPVWHTRRDGTSLWCDGRNPCGPCERAAELQQEAYVRERALDRAGLPPKLRGWSIGTRVVQTADEPAEAFMRRVRALGGPLGVLRCNAHAVEAVEHWVTVGATTSMYLTGEVGRGKSLLAAAALEGLVVPTPGRWRELSDLELLRRWGPKVDRVPASRRRVWIEGRRVDALYIDEAELMARVRLGWSGDKDPLRKVSDAPVLVLDDLGIELVAAPKGSDRRMAVAQAMERLVAYRYDRGLPMLITTNLPWSAIVDDHVYGRRVADRLSEMVGGNRWALEGPSWRGVQVVEKVDRAMGPQMWRRTVDGRALAAGGDL